MRDTELYQQVLGLTAPWSVDRVELNIDGGRVDIWVEHEPAHRWGCPECGQSLSCRDHAEERVWRHLDTCQLMTYLHARVPRVACPEHGVRQVAVPWAEPHSRFTMLMERLIIDVAMQCATVSGVRRLLRTGWGKKGVRAKKVSGQKRCQGKKGVRAKKVSGQKRCQAKKVSGKKGVRINFLTRWPPIGTSLFMPRPPRITEPGLAYHLLNRRVLRLPLFKKERDYAAFENVLAAALARPDAPRLLAYCLMPNHWHRRAAATGPDAASARRAAKGSCKIILTPFSS